jgi:hypothetical protein
MRAAARYYSPACTNCHVSHALDSSEPQGHRSLLLRKPTSSETSQTIGRLLGLLDVTEVTHSSDCRKQSDPSAEKERSGADAINELEARNGRVSGVGR